MTIRDLMIGVGFEVDQQSEKKVDASVENLKGKMSDAVDGLSGFASKMFAMLGVSFTLNGIKSLAATAAAADAAGRKFSLVFTDVNTGINHLNESIGKLKPVADGSGIEIGRLKAGFADLTTTGKAMGMGIEEASSFAANSLRLGADSSSFFGRSIEETTQLVKAFMRGNQKAGQELGIQATDAEKDSKALSQYGRTFKDLTNVEKQHINLKLWEGANKRLGIIGAAAKSSGSYANQMANLNQKFKEFRTSIGGVVLPPFLIGLRLCVIAMTKLVDVTKAITGKGNFFNKLLKSWSSLMNKLTPSTNRLSKAFSGFYNKSSRSLSRLINLLGGTENVMSLLSLVAASFFAVLAWKGAVAGVSSFISVLKPLLSLFGGFGLQGMLVVAALVALGLILDDFVNFLNGSNSMIGMFFDKIGIGAENARAAIFSAMDNVMSFVGRLISSFSGAIPMIEKIFSAVIAVLGILWRAFSSSSLLGIWKILAGALDVFIGSFQIAGAVIEAVCGLMAGDTEMLAEAFNLGWEGIKNIVSGGVQFCYAVISNIFNAILSVIGFIMQAIFSIIASVFISIVSVISNAVSSAYNIIVSGFSSAMNWLSGISKSAFEWGSDLVLNFITGIENMLPSLGGTVEQVANKIRSVLHFSVPDEGPLTDFETWMPDFITGLSSTLLHSSSKLYNAASTVASGLNENFTNGINRLGVSSSVGVSGTTLGNAYSSKNMNIIQNVNIENEFNGLERESTKKVSKAMDKSANDATDAMVKGLIYAK